MYRVTNLFKKYNQVAALSNISFEVYPNELLGFIGPDGSGKTTLFRILATLLLPDSGEVKFMNYDVVDDFQKIRRYLGYMPGRFSLYADLTVEENLNFFATIYGTSVKENYDLIAEIYSQLEPFRTRPAGKLSGGMKQKLALCCALIHRPTVLILDEPTTGVDAVSRKEFWMLLRKLKQRGVTILVSTPYMDEASLCDRIVLMQKGKIMSTDVPERLIASYPVKLYAAFGDNTYVIKSAISSLPECQMAYLSGRKVHFTMKPSHHPREIAEHLTKLGIENFRIEPIAPTVEDYFIYRMINE
ncbi:MAG: ABC transporter ATP-binding protein [Bacteroidales bacterium]|nr:ABC transporter ATP-binding protein [Bacteroidales bacterium]